MCSGVAGRSRGRHNTNHPKRTVSSTAQTTRERWTEDMLPPTPKWRRRGRHMGQGLWEQGHIRSPTRPMDRRGIPPRDKQEVFGAELYAIYQAVIRFRKWHEHDQEYTIFVDSQAAMKRCPTDHQGQDKKPRGPLSGGVRALRDRETSCGYSGSFSFGG